MYVAAAVGRIDDARRELDELAAGGFTFLPRDHGWLFGMTYLAETAILVGDAQRAAEIERLLAPYADRMGFCSGEVSSGPVDRVRGLLAALAGRHDEAVVLLENAERDAWAKGARLWAVRSSVDRARVLVERDKSGDRGVARRLVDEALWSRAGFGNRARGWTPWRVAGHGGVRRVRASRRPDQVRTATFRRDGDVVDRKRSDCPASSTARACCTCRAAR